MNSAITPIFNKNFVKKRGLWVPWIVHETHWQTHSGENFFGQRGSGSRAQCTGPIGKSVFTCSSIKKKRAWNIRNANATILIGTQINITKVEQKANALVEQKPYFLAVELPCIAKDGCAL